MVRKLNLYQTSECLQFVDIIVVMDHVVQIDTKITFFKSRRHFDDDVRSFIVSLLNAKPNQLKQIHTSHTIKVTVKIKCKMIKKNFFFHSQKSRKYLKL